MAMRASGSRRVSAAPAGRPTTKKGHQMNEFVTAIVFAAAALGVLVVAGVKRIIVREAHVGLLYRNGVLRRELEPGRYFVPRWGTQCDAVDLRRATLTIPSQELLSKDNVGLKITLIVRYSVADATRAARSVQAPITELYTAAQLALRGAITARTIEEILEQRTQIGGEIRPIIAEQASAFGYDVHAIEVKDIAFAGDLKRAFADVIRARQEGRAALERARGESAALRNLANAARMLENNPALLNLRLLQTVESAAGTSGNTFVLGVPPESVGVVRPKGDASEERGS
ncbi:MAG: slipin family protein [Planctomycetota bacterium]|nr:MAG: slipin family protein [Planctomycetota bacterium]